MQPQSSPRPVMDVRARVRPSPSAATPVAAAPSTAPATQPAPVEASPALPPVAQPAMPTHLPVHEPPASDDSKPDMPPVTEKPMTDAKEAPAQDTIPVLDAPVSSKQQSNTVSVAGIVVGTVTVMIILIALTVAVYVQS